MGIYKIGLLQFNSELRVITFQEDELDRVGIKLSEAESNIFEFLIRNLEVFFSKEELLNVGWLGRPVSSNSLPVAIANLRKAIADTDIHIENMPKKGYAAFSKSKVSIHTQEHGGLNIANAVENKDDISKNDNHSHISSKVSLNEAFSFLSEKSSFLYKVAYSICALILLWFYFFLIHGWVSIDCVKLNGGVLCHDGKNKISEDMLLGIDRFDLVLYTKDEVIHINKEEK